MSRLVKYLIVLGILIKSALLVSALSNDNENEEFHEELFVKPLSSGHVNTFFQFTTRWHYGEHKNLYNTKYMPRPIAELLLETDVRELHISLTQGLWRYENWGYPVVDAAPGAEAWAWFTGSNLTDLVVDQQWMRLTSTFSGILCATLNFIDTTNTLSPRYGFRAQIPTAHNPNNEKQAQHVRYASLPREIVCTENLTPWKKLLPCASSEGFASLLNSGYVHNTNYHSISIKMRTICETTAPEHNCLLELIQTANLVYDPKLLAHNNQDFSLRRFFGQGLNGHCVLAKSSKIYVSLDDEAKRYDVTPLPMQNITSIRGGAITKLGVYDVQIRAKLHEDKLFNIAWIRRKTDTALAIVPLPPFYAHRYLLGHGQERGLIVTQLVNTHYTPLSLVLQENIPWFVPIYLHTLKIRVIESKSGSIVGSEIKPHAMHYIPGVQRKRAYHLELALQIPAQCTLQVSIEFDYIFLKWLEYPPDANHGHYLGSAVLTVQLPVARNYTATPLEGSLFVHSINASRATYVQQLRTEALLLSLPTPDFSMPYNVICLACTVVALAFGPIHSVATKRILLDEGAPSLTTSIWRRLFKRNKNKESIKSISNIPIIEELQNVENYNENK